MGFRSVQVYNYRNLKDTLVDVDAREIFLVGENGQGKTNFLESIYLLCYGSSFRTKKDRELIRIGEKSMSVHGTSVTDDDNEVSLKIEEGKKQITLNRKRISDRKQLIQHLPCIIFSHDDIEFVSGPPERRRWFFNQTMSLYNPLFIDILRRYSKIIHMRNTSVRDRRDDLLDVYDSQAAAAGLDLQKRRGKAITKFNKTFNGLFHSVSGLSGNIEIRYMPSWGKAETIDEAAELLRSRRTTDYAFKTTTSGPHRDRIGFYLEGRDFSRIASTGQRRLMSLVLRVAQAKFYTEMSRRAPILLLDDVLLELDAGRRRKFIAELPEYEQAFFTFLPDEHYAAYGSGETKVFSVADGILTESPGAAT
ncbi:MAG: DNA replication/repair protein RecF [Spirochaetales bacterium]|jgi:DNA replication and repair protein RecF|nr:DNA replication/repair protein RecF [Spirochaetales bacterium]